MNHLSINYPTLSAAEDLAHFRHHRHFRHFIRRGGFSSLLTNLRSTTVEIALQIHSILTNKPKVKYAKIILNIYITMRYKKMDTWLFRQTKPKQTQLKPKQSQFDERPKLMQSVHIQRIKKKNVAMGQYL